MSAAVAEHPDIVRGDVGFDDDELMRDLAEACGYVNAAQARLVDLVATALKSGAWQVDGIHSPAHWVGWQCGLSSQHARAVVEVASRVDDLPLTFDAFRRGELGFDQVAPIARRVPGWADGEACSFATVLTVGQLTRSLGRYQFPEEPEPEPEMASSGAADDAVDGATGDGGADGDDVSADATTADAGEDGSGAADAGSGDDGVDERFWLGGGDDGAWRFGGRLAADRGELFNQALTEARDRLFQQGHTDVTWVDALIEICERSLDAVTDPARRDRYRVHVHLQAPVGVDSVYGEGRDSPVRSPTPVMYGPLGQRLPDSVRRYLSCDATLSPVWERDGNPFSVGRSQRTVPERTRRIVTLRDGGCRVPGCDHDRWLDVHHIVHWEDGGPTDTWNLVCLCRHHHRLHHRRGLGISGNADDPDALVFTNRHGRPLRAGAAPTPPEHPQPPPAGRYIHPIGEPFRSDDMYFNPPLHLRKKYRSTAAERATTVV